MSHIIDGKSYSDRAVSLTLSRLTPVSTNRRATYCGWSVVTNLDIPIEGQREKIIMDNYFESELAARSWIQFIEKHIPAACIHAQWLFHLEEGKGSLPSFSIRLFGNFKSLLEIILLSKMLRGG